jgi:hypothetical protein
MSSNNFKAGRHIVMATVILLAMVCFCKNSGNNPQPNKCPLFPQRTVPVDAADPMIRIVSPNGGEVYHIGQQCTVKVCSRYTPMGGAELRICIGDKFYSTKDYAPAPMYVNPMNGDSAEFADHKDSVVIANVFTIPDTFYEVSGTDKISSVTDKCLIQISAYGAPYYPDSSDCYFSIVK